jgi:alkaline phosphatase D
MTIGGHSRRTFLAGLAGAAGLAACRGGGGAGGGDGGGTGGGDGGGRPRPRPPLPDLPDGLFALGVASGDPRPHGVVLWTRLAPVPLEGGGMPEVDVPVDWEVARDERFRRVVRSGTATASPRWGHSVHVDVERLEPGEWYHYRFRVGDEVSPVARTRTAPDEGRGSELRFLFASCQNWQSGLWGAWAHAPEEDPDLVVHLGDYIYEGGPSTSDVRSHNGPEIRTLADYRNRYGLYKGDPALQAIHATCPWVVTWDDHEVENNYAGLLPQDPAEAAEFPARRAAAYQAWWEHQPVRLPPPTGPDLRIYRSVTWGRLARFHVLDTRQYRVDQPCGVPADFGPDCPDRTAPDRTLLGAEQEAWLGRSLRRSEATWDVLANQIVMTSMPLGGAFYNLDQWDGYAAARTKLFDQMREAETENAVVITGDIHAAGVGDVVDEGAGPEAVGTELVGSSISSRFDPSLADLAEEAIGSLPHVRWADVRSRGYVRCDVTEDELVARFQFVEDVTVADTPVATATAWRIEAGTPGAEGA